MSITISPSGYPVLIAQEAIGKFVQPKPGEQAMILADTESDMDWVNGAALALQNHGAEPTIVIVTPSYAGTGQRYLPDMVLKALEETDIYVAMAATTGHSVHDKAIAAGMYDKSRKKNLRVFVFRPVPVEWAREILHVHDYEKVIEWGKKFEPYLNGHKEIHVTSKEGSDFTASIENMTYRAIGCFAHEPGRIGCFADGECYGGPVEYTMEGTIAIDGPIVGVVNKPVLSQPIMVTVKKGKVSNVEGGEEADALKQFIDSNENADVMAEVSIGTNPYFRPTGNAGFTDKRMLGRIHVAFGQNEFQIWPHGTVWSPVHSDAVLIMPSCWVDGKQLLEDGVPVV